MFGGRGFGGTYFGQAGGQGVVPPVPPAGGFGHGGSGFPPDWFQRMLSTTPGRREDDDDVPALLALGLLPR